MFPIIDNAIEYAIGISSEKNRYYYDDRTLYYHNLISGYIDGEYFVPIRFGVKESVDKNNKLYVEVGQNKIDLKVLKLPAAKMKQSNSRLRSDISIAEISENVNSKDLLRYLPDDMISENQRKIKYEGIAETIKYTNDKNGNGVIVAVHINKQNGRTIVNKIASLYSKSDKYGNNKIQSYISEQIDKGNLIDASIKKAPNWFTAKGLQLPEAVQTILNANNTIS